MQTAGTIVVGTGGAAALWLTARRQQTTEIALNQAKDVHALQEQVAYASVADAEARRITDLYAKAIDQLGSEKAPVRLGGLYALERLAQENPGHRQTIVNVVCAYLRMPYELPDESADDDASREVRDDDRNRVQERQVRLTVQRILAEHLHPGKDPGRPDVTFWPDIDLDLSGAVLIEFVINGCHLRTARFGEARFVGPASFHEVRFGGDAWFAKTKFADLASFGKAEFDGRAVFLEAEFKGNAGFFDAKFMGEAELAQAQFAGTGWFTRAKFMGKAGFHNAKFADGPLFNEVEFAGEVAFGDTEFGSEPWLGEPLVIPDEAKAMAAELGFRRRDSWVRLDVSDEVVANRSWPTGWAVEPAPDRPLTGAEGEWSRLVPVRPTLGLGPDSSVPDPG